MSGVGQERLRQFHLWVHLGRMQRASLFLHQHEFWGRSNQAGPVNIEPSLNASFVVDSRRQRLPSKYRLSHLYVRSYPLQAAEKLLKPRRSEKQQRS